MGPWLEDGLHHPHVHPDFDEALLLLGLDPDDLSDLGGEADFSVGEDGEDQEHYLLTRSTAMAIKKDVPHLPLTFTRIDRPYVFMMVNVHEL
jgi:hypothetical protein